MRQILLFLLFVSPVFAFPNLLSFDGFLTNSSGSPLNGSFSFNFSIYNQSGSALWSETQTLTVSSGRLNALLGSSTALTLPFDQDYYLGVKVGSDSELSPRFRVASSAYSYAAKSLVPGANASGNLYVSGNLGVGMTAPGQKLQVNGSIRSDGSIFTFGDDTFLGLWNSNNVDMRFKIKPDGNMSVVNDNGAAEILTFLQNGNVGIGASSPGYKLSVAGDVNIGSGQYLRANGSALIGGDSALKHTYVGTTRLEFNKNDGSPLAVILDNGNVGIGNANPGALLHVYKNFYPASGVLAKFDFGGSYNRLISIGVVAAGNQYIQGWNTAETVGTPLLINPNGGYVGIGSMTTPTTALQVTGTITGTTKNFAIQHPLDPGKTLVHSTLEGPEVAVFYRGEAQLQGGIAKVTLPPYFEALTRKENRTVQLTNIDGFDSLAVKTINGHIVQDGSFTVYSSNPASTQRFFWEVKAVRSDVPPLEVEQKG